MIKIFYHISCIGSWEDIVKDQVNKIVYSGLYDDVDSINCYILGCGNFKALEKCKNLLKSFGNKFIIQKHELFEKCGEEFTISDIKNHINDETKFLYLHTKGVSRYNNETYRLENIYFIIDRLYQNIMDWKNVMEFMLIKNYKECLYELNTHDVVGINWCTSPKHFSGNFWWSTGKYFLTLPNIIENNESYIGINNPNIKEILNTGLEGHSHYFNEYDMNNYIDGFKPFSDSQKKSFNIFENKYEEFINGEEFKTIPIILINNQEVETNPFTLVSND